MHSSDSSHSLYSLISTPKTPSTTSTSLSARSSPKTPSFLCSRTPKTPSSRGDRFIPTRGDSRNRSLSHYNLVKENSFCNTNNNNNNLMDTSPSKELYKSNLATSLFGDEGNTKVKESKVLKFKQAPPAQKATYTNPLRVVYSQQTKNTTVKKSNISRFIPSSPEKVLDAPELANDYYLNLLDWSSNNMLAIALGQQVYLWNASTGSISELFNPSEDPTYVSSLSWAKDGNHLAVGKSNNDLEIWDTTKAKRLRVMKGHFNRISSLSWNGHLLSSGSRDTYIINHDVRQSLHQISTFSAHTQEVCGLAWSPDGTRLASGGNDNLLNIWDMSSMNNEPQFSLSHHTAAVKGLSWCPWQRNILASGGGTADRHLRFWNASTGACLNAIDTGSQVCSIVWAKDRKELISSHGFSQNQLSLWKYPSMTCLGELKGHSSRVLHMARSPDGEMVCSAGADETLCFWRVWPKAHISGKATKVGVKQIARRAGKRLRLNTIR